MCLNVAVKAPIQVAEEDITVYKVGFELDDKRFMPYYEDWFSYKPDERQPDVKLQVHYHEVAEGYHSFNTLEGAKLFKEYKYDSCLLIGVFTIPKGASYIQGMFNCIESIASSTIIFKHFINQETNVPNN